MANPIKLYRAIIVISYCVCPQQAYSLWGSPGAYLRVLHFKGVSFG
jgi:hypothetical protein